MTESEARDWIRARFGEGALARLVRFAALLEQENSRQNLVSQASLVHLWARHIVDSAQLVDLAPDRGLWIDIGTGGGFPGMIVAMLRDAPIAFVEPRRQRACFLEAAAAELGLTNVDVRQTKIAALSGIRAAVASARAVAGIDVLFRDTREVSDRDTVFVFPRGRSGSDELSAIRRSWRGVFHVKQSITDAEAVLVVARGVSRI